ncbi:MAG TPA: DUF559 domain-containing protein [Acidimicrobiia bacterium]|jgi:very-short-patch-repair endonuclease|nr:DUF559 domain-containing protein [Acidimicrobiia bacterium]
MEPKTPSTETYERARRLRRSMTPAEVAVWNRLRRRQLGVRFRRQHPIGPYIVDFACVSARLVVELDGEPHAQDDGGYDLSRSAYLEARGYRVVRFENDWVFEDLDGVIAMISAVVRFPSISGFAGGTCPR